METPFKSGYSESLTMTLYETTYQKKEKRPFFSKYFKESRKTLLLGVLFFLSFWMSFLKIPGVTIVWPNYMVAVLFFWTLYRPNFVPLGFLVLLGVMHDILSGDTLGQAPFLWILVYVSALSQRRFLDKKPFRTIWGFFSFTFLGYLGLKWIFVCVSQGSRGLFFLMMIQFLMTVGAYPFITMFLIQIKKGVSFKILKEAE